MRIIKSSRVLAFVLYAGPAALSGCSSAQAPKQEQAAKTGTLSAALSAVGSDGATYAFPPNSFLVASNANASIFYPIDANDTFTQAVPAGTFALSFSYPSTPTLLRTDASGTTSVAADWTDPQPFVVDIAAGATTDTTFHFNANGLADIVFQKGTLQAHLDVTPGTATAVAFNETGNANFFQQVFFDSTAQYATELNVDLNVDINQALQATLTQPWAISGSNSACAHGTIAVASTASAALQKRIDEINGHGADICVFDYGANDFMYIFSSVYGPAPTIQQTFLPDANYSFNTEVFGYVGDVYDGSTLKESAFTTPLSVTNGGFYHYVYNADFSQTLAAAYGNFTGTFQLAPP